MKNNWPFPAEVKTAVDIMRREMEEDAGEAWPRLMTFLLEGKLEWAAIDPSMMADWHDKNKIALMIVHNCFRPDVRCCVFLSDAFHTVVDKETYGRAQQLYGPNFNKWPKEYVTEAVLVTVNAPQTEGAFLHLGYTRDAENKRIFGELERPPAGGHNRFLFDLRNVTEYGAFCEALLRGRTGRVKVDA